MYRRASRVYPKRKFRRRIARRLLSLVVLLGICAMLFPLPFAPPVPHSTDKDLSEPFPCQNRPCGCQSAAQCWKKCCCFTDTQKVAWAKANNVKVPDFVLVAAKRELEASQKTSSTAGKFAPKTAMPTSNCGCCKKEAVAAANSTCNKDAATVAVTTSQTCDVAAVDEITTAPKNRTSPASKWVMAVFAAECQGQGPFAFSYSCPTIPTQPVLMTTSVAEIETVEIESERLTQLPMRPPLPPPKIV